MFPVYSKIQNNSKDINKSYNFILSIVMLFIFPLCLGLYFCADYFVILVLGSKWAPSVPVVKILSIAAIFHTLVSTAFPLFKGIGLPKFEMYISSLVLFVITLIIIPLTNNYDMQFTAYSILIGSISGLPLWWYFLKKHTSISIMKIIKIFFAPLSITLLIILSITCIRNMNESIISWPIFLSLIFASTVVFLISYYFFLKIVKDSQISRFNNLIKTIITK